MDSLPARAAELEFGKANALVLTYTRSEARASLRLEDVGTVARLVGALKIEGVWQGMQSQLEPYGIVEFAFPHKASVLASFVDAQHLNIGGWGVLVISDAFHREVCLAISRAEGRPMDILRDNE